MVRTTVSKTANEGSSPSSPANTCPGSLTDRTRGYGPRDVGSTPARGTNSQATVD